MMPKNGSCVLEAVLYPEADIGMCAMLLLPGLVHLFHNPAADSRERLIRPEVLQL